MRSVRKNESRDPSQLQADHHSLRLRQCDHITVEICSKCHPFYTGKQKLVDTSGRVDKFNKKYGIK